jgi:hypothetical protein
LVILQPETVIRWHRAGFRSFWRWKSRCRGGGPKVPVEIRQLIRDDLLLKTDPEGPALIFHAAYPHGWSAQIELRESDAGSCAELQEPVAPMPREKLKRRTTARRESRRGAMSLANSLWGAPRIHGELLKLGIDVGQTSVAKYMARHRRPPSQWWRTFLRNHADGIASMDLFVVPTLSFRLLYRLVILRHGRRQILWLGVTAHPSAEWMARQLIEACGWEWTPKYIVRDRDSVYGQFFTRRLRAMGIRDRPTAPPSRHGRMAKRNG